MITMQRRIYPETLAENDVGMLLCLVLVVMVLVYKLFGTSIPTYMYITINFYELLFVFVAVINLSNPALL